ncbi:hypothetical protein GCM10022393_18560 [Aquimarina addita]|uniref:Lipocalin-like domain-containing protein n=1 Tax=Aquimarina addita TaxID=870485 RepID=A0ABP6UKC0_9FLAO
MVLSSCSKDDDGDDGVAAEGTIVVDGTTVNIASSIIEDYGSFEGFYNYDFILTGASGNEPYILYFELFSPVEEGDEEFKTGTFQYTSDESPTEAIFYFNNVFISKGDEIQNETGRSATSGTITVSGSGSNYKVIVDVTLEDDAVLTANYDGAFIINDESY